MMKSVRVRIFLPGNKRSKVQVYRAPAGRVYNDKGLDVLLSKIADNITKQWPDEDYGLVPVGGSAYNFVHRGKLETA